MALWRKTPKNTPEDSPDAEEIIGPRGRYAGMQAVSQTRRQRRRLCAEYGITSGRQWVRLRRALRMADRMVG